MKEEHTTTTLPPQGSDTEEDMNIMPFQSISYSSESSDYEEQLTYDTKREKTTSQCEIDFGDVIAENSKFDVRHAVLSVASNLMDAVGIRKVEDDDLLSYTHDPEEALTLRSKGSMDSYSIPPEIEMLQMEADLLLESIRHGISPEEKMNSPKKSAEADYFCEDALDDFLQRKQYNFDDLDEKDDDEVEEESYEVMSLSSFLTDDDGMRGEIQNLGSSVSNLRRDLERYNRYDDCGSLCGLTQASVSEQSSIIRETWSRALNEIATSIKALRRLGKMSTRMDSTAPGRKSKLRYLVNDWVFTILWSAAIFIAGIYFRARHISGNAFNELEGLDILENVDWMFAKQEQNESAHV